MNIPLLIKKIWDRINPLRYYDLLASTFRKDELLIRKIHDFKHGFSERLCIFSSFNRDGIVPEATYFQLQAIKDEGFNIFFIANGILNENHIKTLGKICSKVIVKKNSGYDWGAYFTGIKIADYKLRKQLLLINDSVFGPLFPLGEMFRKISGISCDCWGVTGSYEKKFHIQSYFLVINHNLLLSGQFAEFWNDFRLYNNRLNVIKKYELGFSHYLTSRGFHLETYIPYKQLCWPPDRKKSNITHFFWKEMICQYRVPFIKKDFLLRNPMRIKNHSEWEDVINNNTEYDIEFIKKY